MKIFLVAVLLSVTLGCSDSRKKEKQCAIVIDKCNSKNIINNFKSDSAIHIIDGAVLSSGAIQKISKLSSTIVEERKIYGCALYPQQTCTTDKCSINEVRLSKNKIIFYFNVDDFQSNDSDEPENIKYREIFILNYPQISSNYEDAIINRKIRNSFYSEQLKLISRSHLAIKAYLIDSCEFVKSKSTTRPDLLGGTIDVRSISLYSNDTSSFLSIVSASEIEAKNETRIGLFTKPLYFDLKSLKLVKPDYILGKNISFKIDYLINNCFLKIPPAKFFPLRKTDWELQFDEEGFFLTTNELQGIRFTGRIWAYVPFCSVHTP